MKVGNKHIEKCSKMECVLVPKQMGRFLGTNPRLLSPAGQRAPDLFFDRVCFPP